MNPTDLATKTLAHYDADDTLLHDEAPTRGSACELCDWMEDATVSLRALVAEVAAWRERFPQHTYRPQDDCVALRA